MGIEIERKFLVANDAWRDRAGEGTAYRQGYLAAGPPTAIRVRLEKGKATLNIKKATLELRRDEFEYPIPIEDAEALLDGLCEGHAIEKTRYKLPYASHTWEIDVFAGVNDGLIVAEIELTHEDQPFERPSWLGPEVSGDPRYLNSSLSRVPYRDWPKP